jgi:ribonuclease HI
VKQVTIYTDGACLGNPGPGGYGVVLLYNGHRKELSGGYRCTTNNRMEILAAIVGLRALKQGCKVTLYSDSRYVVDAITLGWAERWKRSGWIRNKAKEKAINPDLWEELLDLCAKHEVEFKWVRGHSGVKENERADRLSVEAAQKPNLPPDPGYDRSPGPFNRSRTFRKQT